MEVVRTIGSVMGSIKMLVDLIEKNTERGCKLRVGLNCIKQDLEILLQVRAAREELQLNPAMQLQLQELAYDIDDFIQDRWDLGEFGSFMLTAIGADSRPGLMERVEDFKQRIKNLTKELPKSCESIPGKVILTPASLAGSPIHYAPEVDLVGIKEPKKEIVELLSPRVDPHAGRLSLIAMLGCSGSGKTALARALYEDDDVVNKFNCKAWVVASDPSSADIVYKIRQEVVSTSPHGTTPEALHHFQKDKRYLIFVDDVQQGTTCEEVRDALDENVMDSKIIVTTGVPSVAMECSSGRFFYKMQGLDKENSRELFRRKFLGKTGYSEEDKYRLGDTDVDVIVDKCDGLPIALISTADCLRRKGLAPKREDFVQVSQELRDGLADFQEFQKQNGTATKFAEMRRARVEPYMNQLNNGEKECLLYATMFPCRHEINSKSLIRRLIVEGLVPGDRDIVKAPELVVGDVRECVRKLQYQHMVEPIPIRNYSNVAKRCRVHSIMLEFTIKKAVSRNFVSLLHNDKPLHSTTGSVRRLTVQSSPLVRDNKCPEGMNLSVLRSLAIFKSKNLDFEQCGRVRVLDLESCHDLTPKDLDNICGLRFLKYLSLRNTGILELPEKVKTLMFLEMLDTRDSRDRETVVLKLPVEVLMLPRFAYLFGKFELTNVHSDDNTKMLTRYFSDKKSQLHTLGGIAVHEKEGLDVVLLAIDHATKLKKVKVWYRDAPCVATTSAPAAGDSRRKFLVGLFRKRMLCAGPPADPQSNPQDPAPAAQVTNGKVETIPSASRRVLRKQKWNPVRLLGRSKPSAEPSTDPSTNAPVNSIPGHLLVVPSADSSTSTRDPAPVTCTPLASDTSVLRDCVSRLTKTLKNHPTNIESLSIDFNGVSNTFLEFLQINGTISSIKLRRGQGSLPGSVELGQVSNLKKLHLFSTGLKSEQLASLQALKCLQYLKLTEEGLRLWDSVFHVQDGGFISLIWLCFEASNLKHPPLKIDEGAKTPLNSLLLLCKDSKGPEMETPVPIYPEIETEGLRVDGIPHLAKLNEVILHNSASDAAVEAWKEEAKRHINMPYVEKQRV